MEIRVDNNGNGHIACVHGTVKRVSERAHTSVHRVEGQAGEGEPGRALREGRNNVGAGPENTTVPLRVSGLTETPAVSLRVQKQVQAGSTGGWGRRAGRRGKSFGRIWKGNKESIVPRISEATWNALDQPQS